MNATQWMMSILQERQPLLPLDSDVQPKLRLLNGVRSVIFDVYGTLIVSGSGDVGSVDQTDRSQVIQRAIKLTQLEDRLDRPVLWSDLRRVIEQMNAERKSEGCISPEVDVIAAWRQVIDEHGWKAVEQNVALVVRLATCFEAWSNPTWPMPGVREMIDKLSRSEVRLGIISNAQVFTPLLVEDLLFPEKKIESVFQVDLCFFSNRFRHSKPGPRLFRALTEALQRRGILPQETLYVGNDMLNDVWGASQVGMKTAWFAGDKRSKRSRSGDPRCCDLSPDLILTSLPQLLECLKLS